MTKHCIITGDPITAQNDSKAHIIPSALGGRLKPLGIICANANNLLGDKIDLPLIQAFQSLMNLLDGSRDRGDNQPTRMTDESGKTYVFEFGEPLALTKPEYQELEIDGQTHIQIKARNLKEARTVLGRVKAKYPSFDIDEALKLAVTEHRWPDGMLNHKMQIGPSVVFPAVFVAASIFASFLGQTPHPQLKAYVSSFDPKAPTLPADTFYFIPAVRWIDVPADVAHCLVFLGDAATKKALVYIELFNIACVGVILPFDGAVDIAKTYSINVLNGEEIAIQINEEVAKSTPWAATHHLGDTALYAFTQEKMSSLISVAMQRQWDNNIQGIVQRALGEPDGRPLLPQDCANIIKEVAEFTKVLWMHPGYTREVRQAQLSSFDDLCKGVKKMLPFFARCKFRHLIRPYCKALADVAEAD